MLQREGFGGPREWGSPGLSGSGGMGLICQIQGERMEILVQDGRTDQGQKEKERFNQEEHSPDPRQRSQRDTASALPDEAAGEQVPLYPLRHVALPESSLQPLSALSATRARPGPAV